MLLLWAYALLTGLSASVVRASLMFSLIAIGISLQRKPQIYNTISLSAFFMLLLNPDYLFDVGFRLSYFAVVAIIYLQPKIKRLFYIKNKVLRWVWDLTAVSIAAQIGTAPFSVFYFNQFPNYFLLTNLAAIPLATVIIYVTVTLFILSPVPYVSDIVAWALRLLLKSLNFSVETIHNLPFPVSLSFFNSWQVLLLYMAIVFFLFFLKNKKFPALALALSSLLIFFSINLSVNIKTLSSSRFVVFADRKNTQLDFISGKEHAIYTGNLRSTTQLAGAYWLSRKLNLPELTTNVEWFSDNAGTFCGKTFYVLSDDTFREKLAEHPLEVDFLIVGNATNIAANRVLESVLPQMVIVDLTVSDRCVSQFSEICQERDISCYSVKKSGAFICDFSKTGIVNFPLLP
jgi:competence protein ComEC